MKHILTLALVVLLCTIARAQNTGDAIVSADTDANGTGAVILQTRNLDRVIVNNDGTVTMLGRALTLGNASGTNSQEPARINLRTMEAVNASLLSQSYEWSNNGTYYDHVQRWGFNGQEGVKQIPGEVQYELTTESKWWSGTAWQTEIYWSWTNPDGVITYRPWGMTINHETGSIMQNMIGRVVFQRQYPDHGGLFADFNDGRLDLSYVDGSSITFKNNNTGALVFRNAGNTNSIPVATVNALDQVVLAPGAQSVVIPGPSLTLGDTGSSSRLNVIKINSRIDPNTYIDLAGLNYIRFYSNSAQKMKIDTTGVDVNGDLRVDGSYKVDNVKVVGNQCAAIANSNGTQADDTRAINAILTCMRSHGLVAQ